MPEYKNLRIRKDTFDMLERNKSEGVTWDHHLEQLQYAMDTEIEETGETMGAGVSMAGTQTERIRERYQELRESNDHYYMCVTLENPPGSDEGPYQNVTGYVTVEIEADSLVFKVISENKFMIVPYHRIVFAETREDPNED